MNILVLNCGSSSIKYQLLDMKNNCDGEVIAKGLVERIGLEEGVIKHKTTKEVTKKLPIRNHSVGISAIFELLIDEEYGALKSLDEIKGVGHRVAHGGSYFSDSALLNTEVIEKIDELCELAPLHNPAHLRGINTVTEKMPNVKQVAVFDTAFHQTLPPKAYMYAIPYEIYSKLKVRKYGFHGTSHQFVAQKACDILGWDITEKKIITCHLGNGASITAIDGGKSVDTSMGFTPNEGMIMGTRTGNLDLGALLFIAEKKHLSLEQSNSLINKESGLKGVSEVSSDMRDLEESAKSGNKQSQLALDMFAYQVKKFIGSYTAVMGGLDLLVFTGGIGENDMNAREKSTDTLEYLGLKFDKERNNVRGKDAIISAEGSKVIAMTITTDEELVIARDTMRIINE